MSVNPKVRVPKTAAKGDIIELKTMLSGHDMEPGYRKDQDGNLVPRLIIKEYKVTLNDQEIFRADVRPGIAANPYFVFFHKVEDGGTFKFTWTDDNDQVYEATGDMQVS